MYASSQRSIGVVNIMRGPCTAVDCNRLMLMKDITAHRVGTLLQWSEVDSLHVNTCRLVSGVVTTSTRTCR